MSLTLDYSHDDKVLHSDNILVRGTKDMLWFFSIYVTDRGATISRYCVPGRLDEYSFAWIPGGCGIGSRVAYFTDTHWSLNKAMKQLERDFKKKQVKQLIKEALAKIPRQGYLTPLLEALQK